MLLGLDLGTSSIKALLLDRAGQEHRVTTVVTPFERGEVSVPTLMAAVATVIRQLGPARGRVAGVGIAGMAESGAPFDRHGETVGPVIAWNDRRGAEVVERLAQRFGPGLERAIGQRLRTVSSVAKLGWLVDRATDPVRHWLGVPELVLWALTGSQATEYSLAARTGAYHIGDRCYLPEVLAVLGVPPDVFASVQPAGAAMGRISDGGATWSGLPTGLPVTVAGHDHLVGWAGAGAGTEHVANSVGTAETVVAATVDRPDPDRALSLRVAVTLAPGGETWAVLASAARSGMVLSAVARALACSVTELDRAASGESRVAIGDEVITCATEGRPLPLPWGSPAEVWNGVLDALSARTWAAVDRLDQAAAQPIGQAGLVVFGGGSRSRPWLDAKAAARPGVAVWQSPAREAVALGAARYAGVATGWWPDPDAAPRGALHRV